MSEIERISIKHGCTRAKVSTWEFQALDFYRKRGYEIYGTLENFPEGVRDYQLWKPLA